MNSEWRLAVLRHQVLASLASVFSPLIHCFLLFIVVVVVVVVVILCAQLFVPFRSISFHFVPLRSASFRLVSVLLPVFVCCVVLWLRRRHSQVPPLRCALSPHVPAVRRGLR